MTDKCRVCGEPIPDEYGKFDPKAPVYGPEAGDVHHLGCEDDLFDEVYSSV